MTAWDAIFSFLRGPWDLRIDQVGLILALGALYFGAVIRHARSAAEPADRGRMALFLLGLSTLAYAVASPFDRLADDYLFSAHMLQHQMLTLIVPPLLLLGMPGWMARPLLSAPWIARVGRTHAYPVVAFGAFNLLFAVVHFPAIYDRLFGDEIWHFATHAVIVGTGILTWLPLFSPVPDVLPRLSLPGQLLYCFVQTIPGSFAGSLITLADGVLYRRYGDWPLAMAMSPLADQQLGGLLMWVVQGTFFLILLTVLFFIWANREEKDAYGFAPR